MIYVQKGKQVVDAFTKPLEQIAFKSLTFTLQLEGEYLKENRLFWFGIIVIWKARIHCAYSGNNKAVNSFLEWIFYSMYKTPVSPKVVCTETQK